MAASYDHSPLFRSSVGFDRVFNLLEDAQRARSTSDWPPYDIVKTDDEAYRISIAVAGFAQDDVEITFQSTLLTVIGKKQDESAEDYLHRGIASRPFEHRFELADHDKVMSGSGQRPSFDRARPRDSGGIEAAKDLDPEHAGIDVGRSNSDRSSEGCLTAKLVHQVRAAPISFPVGKERAMKPDMFRQPATILVGLGYRAEVRSVLDACRHLLERLTCSRRWHIRAPQCLPSGASRRDRSRNCARRLRSVCGEA